MIAFAWLSTMLAIWLAPVARADSPPPMTRGIYVNYFDPIDDDDDPETIAEKKRGRLVPLSVIHDPEATKARQLLAQRLDLSGGLTAPVQLSKTASTENCLSTRPLADGSIECQRNLDTTVYLYPSQMVKGERVIDFTAKPYDAGKICDQHRTTNGEFMMCLNDRVTAYMSGTVAAHALLSSALTDLAKVLPGAKLDVNGLMAQIDISRDNWNDVIKAKFLAFGEKCQGQAACLKAAALVKNASYQFMAKGDFFTRAFAMQRLMFGRTGMPEFVRFVAGGNVPQKNKPKDNVGEGNGKGDGSGNGTGTARAKSKAKKIEEAEHGHGKGGGGGGGGTGDGHGLDANAVEVAGGGTGATGPTAAKGTSGGKGNQPPTSDEHKNDAQVDGGSPDGGGLGLKGDFALPDSMRHKPTAADKDHKNDPYDATNGDFPIGGMKSVKCPDFIPRTACLAGGQHFDITHYREATRKVTRMRNCGHGEMCEVQEDQSYFKYETSPDVALSSSTSLGDLIDGAYSSVKTELEDDMAKFMADGYIESYLQSSKLNSETDAEFEGRLADLKKAAACFPGEDKTIDSYLRKLPPRSPGAQRGFKMGMANAGQCMNAIMPRWSELRAIMGLDVEIARPILKAEEIEKLPFGVRHLVGGLTGLPVVRHLLREMPYMTGFAEQQGRPCSFLQQRMNPALSNDEQQQLLGELRKFPVSRMEYCMDAYAEFSLLTREMNDLYAQFPLIGEKSSGGGRTYEDIAKAAGPNPALKNYNLNLFGKDADKVYDHGTGQLRTCMLRLRDENGHPTIPPQAAVDAVNKIVGDKESPALTSITEQLSKLCDKDKRSDIVDGAVQDPNFMSRYFSCDRTLFNTLNTFQQPRPKPLPLAIDAETCRLRQTSSWAVCRRYKDVVNGERKSEAYGQMLQLGMDMLFIAAPGVGGGFAPTAGRMVAGAAIGGGLGYALGPNTGKMRDQNLGDQADFRAGYASVDKFDHATDALAKLAERNPRVESLLSGAVMGGTFAMFAGAEGGAVSRGSLAADARAATRRALQAPESAAAAEQQLIAAYRALGHENLFTGDAGQAARKGLNDLFRQELEARYPDVSPEVFKKLGGDELVDILDGNKEPPGTAPTKVADVSPVHLADTAVADVHPQHLADTAVSETGAPKVKVKAAAGGHAEPSKVIELTDADIIHDGHAEPSKVIELGDADIIHDGSEVIELSDADLIHQSSIKLHGDDIEIELVMEDGSAIELRDSDLLPVGKKSAGASAKAAPPSPAKIAGETVPSPLPGRGSIKAPETVYSSGGRSVEQLVRETAGVASDAKLEVLGKGGMNRVFVDPANPAVAVKVLDRELIWTQMKGVIKEKMAEAASKGDTRMEGLLKTMLDRYEKSIRPGDTVPPGIDQTIARTVQRHRLLGEPLRNEILPVLQKKMAGEGVKVSMLDGLEKVGDNGVCRTPRIFFGKARPDGTMIVEAKTILKNYSKDSPAYKRLIELRDKWNNAMAPYNEAAAKTNAALGLEVSKGGKAIGYDFGNPTDKFGNVYLTIDKNGMVQEIAIGDY